MVRLGRLFSTLFLVGALLGPVKAHATCDNATQPELFAQAAAITGAFAAVQVILEQVMSFSKQMLEGGKAALEALQIAARGKVADKQSQDMHETARQENMAKNIILAQPARTCQVATGAAAITKARLQFTAVSRQMAERFFARIGTGAQHGQLAYDAAVMKDICEKYGDPNSLGRIPGCAGGPAALRNMNVDIAAHSEIDTYPPAADGTIGDLQKAGYVMVDTIVGPPLQYLSPAVRTGSSAGLVVGQGQRGDMAALGIADAVLRHQIDERTPTFASSGSNQDWTKWGSELLRSIGYSPSMIPAAFSVKQMRDILTRDRFKTSKFHTETLGKSASKEQAVQYVETLSSYSIGQWAKYEAAERQAILVSALLAREVQQRRHDTAAASFPTQALGSSSAVHVGAGQTTADALVAAGYSREDAELYAALAEVAAQTTSLDPNDGIEIVKLDDGGFRLSVIGANGAVTGSTTVSASGQAVLSAALKIASESGGLEYVWGGNGPSDGGYDCSGYVSDVLKQIDPSFQRTDANGIVARLAQTSTPQPGDVIYFPAENGKWQHVGIVTGFASDGRVQWIGSNSSANGISTVTGTGTRSVQYYSTT
jgi:cell wall-associated NlpC family hydrolase